MTDAELRGVADEITEWRRAGVYLTTARIDRLCAVVEALIGRELDRTEWKPWAPPLTPGWVTVPAKESRWQPS